MKFKLSATLFLVLAVEAMAHATPITYSISTYASGTLGASTFTDQLVTISYFGDTTGLTTVAGSIVNTGGISGVDVAGLGSALFTDSTEFFITGSANFAAIYDITASSVVGSFNGAFASYAGDTSLGPLVSLYYTLPSYSFGTTSGALVISSLTSTDNLGAFEADLAPVPEPSTLLFVGTGIAGVFSAIRKRLT